MSITPPDPNVLRTFMSAANAGNTMSAQESAYYHNPNTMRNEYGIPEDAYAGALQIMDSANSSETNNPFSAIPVASSRGEFYEAIEIFSEQSGAFLHPDDISLYPEEGPAKGFNYPNMAENPMTFTGPDNAPADITETPTSTTNPARPRTVAAGYDPRRKVLTVVFRDGTYYNYYGVNTLTWANFKRARSKGRFIYTYLDGMSRGPANVSSLPENAREALYRVTRTGQVKRQGLTGTHSASSKRGGRGSYAKGNLGGTGRKRAKKAS